LVGDIQVNNWKIDYIRTYIASDINYIQTYIESDYVVAKPVDLTAIEQLVGEHLISKPGDPIVLAVLVVVIITLVLIARTAGWPAML
jgi:hypothetical protein